MRPSQPAMVRKWCPAIAACVHRSQNSWGNGHLPTLESSSGPGLRVQITELAADGSEQTFRSAFLEALHLSPRLLSAGWRGSGKFPSAWAAPHWRAFARRKSGPGDCADGGSSGGIEYKQQRVDNPKTITGSSTRPDSPGRAQRPCCPTAPDVPGFPYQQS